jgi:hypothetical protein
MNKYGPNQIFRANGLGLQLDVQGFKPPASTISDSPFGTGKILVLIFPPIFFR